jgi:two-component system, NtrC family, response regulator AtoC
MSNYRILVVDDEKLIRWSLKKSLDPEGYTVELAESGEEAIAKVKEESPDLILLDIRLSGMDGISVLRQVKAIDDSVEVIMLTAYGAVETAVQAMRLGAFEYLNKPFNVDELRLVVARALEHGKLRRQASQSFDRLRSDHGLDAFIGESPSINALKEMVLQIASSNTTTILIQGESGTGKDVLAEVLHYESSRHDKPFISVNSPSLSEGLFESELFGHQRGAFTDAKVEKKGLLEVAKGGTLFLNEIGDLREGEQVNLLHVLEEKKFRRVGGVRDIEADVRIIAATNKDLRALVAEGRFREDLFYRLNVISLFLPPLRDRGEDRQLLARYFLEIYNRQMNRDFEDFSREALEYIMVHPWSGNVRELKNAIERAVILGRGRLVELEWLQGSESLSPSGPGGPSLRLPAEGLNIENVERELIEQALSATNGNQVRAAQLLGIGRDALRYRMKKFDLL